MIKNSFYNLHEGGVKMDEKKLMKELLDKFYYMYIYEEEIYKLYEDKRTKALNKKLIKLDKRLNKVYKEHQISEEKFRDILENLFDTYNDMTCVYRKHDFQQGLMVGLSLTKFSQMLIKPEMIERWMNEIFVDEYEKMGQR